MSNEETFRHISAEEFSGLDFSTVTLLDLREPDEVLVSGIDGAINLPFSAGFEKLDAVPKDKPVIVFCRVGDWSEQIAEILADRGYDVSRIQRIPRAEISRDDKRDSGSIGENRSG